jgi:hypothetical protein
MKKLFVFVMYLALIAILVLSMLAMIGVAAQAPGTSELIQNFQNTH